MDAGILFLRLLLSLVLFIHAAQKTVGWFNGPGLVGATEVFRKLGQSPPRFMVQVAALCELLAALLLVLGLLIPLGAAVALGTMIVAGYSQSRLSGHVWNAAGGGEYPLVLGLLAAGLALTGGGALALDASMDLAWASDQGQVHWWGMAGIALGLVAAVGPISRTTLHLRHQVA